MYFNRGSTQWIIHDLTTKLTLIRAHANEELGVLYATSHSNQYFNISRNNDNFQVTSEGWGIHMYVVKISIGSRLLRVGVDIHQTKEAYFYTYMHRQGTTEVSYSPMLRRHIIPRQYVRTYVTDER